MRLNFKYIISGNLCFCRLHACNTYHDKFVTLLMNVFRLFTASLNLSVEEKIDADARSIYVGNVRIALVF